METSLLIFGVPFLFGAMSAKWALELGFSQVSQLLHFIAGLFIGPLVLLILYLRLIRQRKQDGLPGGQMFGD